LDLAELRRTLESAVAVGRLEAIGSDDPAVALDRLQLRADGQLRRAAIVAFGRRLLPGYPQCGLRLARFRGTTKDEFFDQRRLHGHAFTLLEGASTFLA